MQNGRNGNITSENRNKVIAQLSPESEYLFFIDDDTVPPVDALDRLLAHQHPFVTGTYYHRNSPHLPLVYERSAVGLYDQVMDFEQGAIFQGEQYATGLGCALIHKSVFKAIREQFIQLQRPNGSRFLVHQDDLREGRFPSRLVPGTQEVLDNGDQMILVMQVKRVLPQWENQFPFPYFEMEHGRTEDFGFCERAARCGFFPRIDTGIKCDHWHLFPVTHEQFEQLREYGKRNGELPELTDSANRVRRDL
jgi:hypothetical protein